MYIFQVIIAVGILYGTGWNILGGIPFLDFSIYAELHGMKGSTDFMYGGEGFAFFLNSKYYGMIIVDRYFDSSFISWAGFWIAISSILPFRFFFFSTSD